MGRGSTRGSPATAPAVARADFEIAATCHVQIVEDAAEKAAVINGLKPVVALYMGGMGAKEQNFHKQVFDRMGYESITRPASRSSSSAARRTRPPR